MEDSSTSWFVFASVLLKCFAAISPPSNVQWQTNLRNFCIPRAIASAIYRSPKNRCTVCLYRRTLLRYSNKLPKSCIALTRACSYGSGVSDRAHHRPQRGCTNQPLRKNASLCFRHCTDPERRSCGRADELPLGNELRKVAVLRTSDSSKPNDPRPSSRDPPRPCD